MLGGVKVKKNKGDVMGAPCPNKTKSLSNPTTPILHPSNNTPNQDLKKFYFMIMITQSKYPKNKKCAR